MKNSVLIFLGSHDAYCFVIGPDFSVSILFGLWVSILFGYLLESLNLCIVRYCIFVLTSMLSQFNYGDIDCYPHLSKGKLIYLLNSYDKKSFVFQGCIAVV